MAVWAALSIWNHSYRWHRPRNDFLLGVEMVSPVYWLRCIVTAEAHGSINVFSRNQDWEFMRHTRPVPHRNPSTAKVMAPSIWLSSVDRGPTDIEMLTILEVSARLGSHCWLSLLELPSTGPPVCLLGPAILPIVCLGPVLSFCSRTQLYSTMLTL